MDNRRQQRFFKIVLALMALVLGGGIVLMPFVGLPAFNELFGGGGSGPNEAIKTARSHLAKAEKGSKAYRSALQELATGYLTLAAPDQTTGEEPKNAGKSLGKASEAFEELTRLEPTNMDYLQGLASVYGRQNQYAKAQKIFQKLVRIEPENEDYWYAWAQASDAAGDKTTAILAYQKFLKLLPDAPQADGVKERIKELKKPTDQQPGVVTSGGGSVNIK